MHVHEPICALHRTRSHVRCAQNNAWMHMWCMYAMHCVLMCTCVHLCAPALRLSALVSMRHTHSIHTFMLELWRCTLWIPNSEMCLELQLHFWLQLIHCNWTSPCSESTSKSIHIQFMNWTETQTVHDKQGHSCQLNSKNALDTSTAFMHACQIK